MKVYQEKPEKLEKNWSIELTKDANIIVVDAIVGNHICDLISFYENGEIHIHTNALQKLKDNGYDQGEHNNKWNDDGSIEINRNIT